jgi:class 3 adenylate cyclase
MPWQLGRPRPANRRVAARNRIVQALGVEPPEVRYARNGDVALAFQVFGDGPVDLVFLPQWVNNIELAWENPIYASFLHGLGSFARVLMLDRRGVGLSDRFSAGEVPPLEVLVDDLGVVIAEAGFVRPALFGGADSGSIGALYAATRPEETVALIVFGSAARGRVSSDYPWAWTADQWDAYLVELAAGWGTTAYAHDWWEITAPSHRADARLERWFLAFQRLSASPGVMGAIERIWHDIDIRPVLTTLSVPTLVLHRTGDPIEAVEAGRDFARTVPGARFVELPGDDWFVWAGDQQRVLREVEAFLRELRDEEAELDRMLATVLFTDIVASTERNKTLGDRPWKQLREQHDATVRAMFARYRGLEQDNAGDGFFATFDGPARAVRCAQAIIETVSALGLEIRAGIHTGEVAATSGKVSGIAVNIGARIAALAEPSDVLVSQTVKDLVAGSGIAFEERGEHELKGVPGRWRLYVATA